MESDFLFHYTNLSSLALILKSKKIKLNSLMKVDDKEEGESQDIFLGGKYCFVSSWTNDESESIPMWNLYSNLSGIRIKMKKNPFIKYKWEDPLLPGQQVESYLSLEQIKEYDIFPFFPESGEILYKVEYTDAYDKIYPRLKKDVTTGYHIEYERLGKYKRICWDFQKEWRYIMYVRPVRLSEYIKSIDHGKCIYKNNIKKNVDLQINELFLDIDPKYLDNIEILCGPKMSEGEKILLKCLLDKYCPNGIIKESELKMR